MSKDDSITNNNIGIAAVWSLAAEFVAKLIVPVTNMILARILTPNAFGIIATITVVISFAEIFSTAGFQKFIVQHEFTNEDKLYNSATVAFWTNMLISLLAWMVIAFFSIEISAVVGCEGYELPLIIASLSLPLTSLSSIHEALFQRKLEYKVLFVRRVVVSLVPFVVTIPLAFFGMGFWALIIGTLVGNLVKFVMLSLSTKWRPSFFYSIELLVEMLSYGIWTLLEAIAMWASTYIDVLIISNKLGEYYTGLYKNSQSTVTGILAIITGGTTSVLFASLSRIKNDEKRFAEVLYTFQKYVAMFVLPIGVGIFCFSDLITLILLGEQWMEASLFIGVWGLCTSLVCVFGTFSREVYRAKGKPQISLIAQLIHLAFVIPVCLVSVGKGFGVLSYTRSFAYLQIILVHFVIIKVVFKLSPKKMLWGVKEPILCSLVMGGLALGMLYWYEGSYVVQFAYIFVCVLVYFGSLCMFTEYRMKIGEFVKKIRYKFFKKRHTDEI